MSLSEDAPPRTPHELLSPRQVAGAFGVSESSLKRWCDQGLIASTLTPGGHRRLPLQGILEFARTTKHSLVHPEVLGLPASVGQQRWSWETALPALLEAFVSGSDIIARQILLDAFVRGASLAEIGDRLVAPALHKVGDLWQCGELEVYRERRSCRIALRVILELRSLLPAPGMNQPLAMGGTVEGDYYDLPTSLVETVLIQAGWRAVSLGSSLPSTTVVSAIHEHRPQMFWLSVSHLEKPTEFAGCLREIASAARAANTKLVIGGRAVELEAVQQVDSVKYYANLQELVAGEPAAKLAGS